MELGRDRDDREVGLLRIEQGGDRGEDSVGVVDRAKAVATGIDGAGEVDAGARLQQTRVMAAHHPEPEDGAA